MSNRLVGVVGAVALMAVTGAGTADTARGSRQPVISTVHGGRPASATVTTGSTPADVTTYHATAKRSGNEPAAALSTMTSAWTRSLGAAVYGQPLVLTISGVRTVVVATEADVVYGLDPATGTVRWSTAALGTPAVASQLPCGNISPLGITGTPVYDSATQRVWVVTESSDGGIHHDLIAIDPSSGRVMSRTVADPAGQDPTVEQQRGALFVENGTVYVPYGGLSGDCGAYHGYVVAINERTHALTSYQTPSSREAGIWAPPGLVADHLGNLYVAVGNGAATSGKWDLSDSTLELSPTLTLLGAFAPSSWPTDNAADLDLGSTAPTVLANGVVFADGKSTTAYTMREGHLGGVGSELSHATICASYGGTAYFLNTVYVPCRDGIRSVKVSTDGHMTIRWHAPSDVAGSPVVSGATVYALDRAAGTLVALAVSTGAVEGSVPVGAVTRFATPALSGTQAFIGTTTGVTAINGV